MSDYHVRSPSRGQRDAQTRNLRSRSSSRDMSWRKPVPKFLPSPQISPDQSQSQQWTSSPTDNTFGYMVDRTNPFSMSLTSLKNDLPPLPNDWKENIDRAMRNESSTNLRALRTPPISPVVTSPTRGFAHGYYHYSTGPQIAEEQAAFQEVDLGVRKYRDHHCSENKENIPPPVSNHGLKRLAMSSGMNESSVSVARIPKTYRPPTPPILSRKRPSAPPTPITTTMSKPVHIIYPDLTGLGAETYSQRAKSPESDDTVDTHTARSSLTAWTNTVGASMDTSTLTDDDDQTLPVYRSHSIRKSATISKPMLVSEPQNPEPGFRKSVGLWFDSFFSSFGSCLAGY